MERINLGTDGSVVGTGCTVEQEHLLNHSPSFLLHAQVSSQYTMIVIFFVKVMTLLFSRILSCIMVRCVRRRRSRGLRETALNQSLCQPQAKNPGQHVTSFSFIWMCSSVFMNHLPSLLGLCGSSVLWRVM